MLTLDRPVVFEASKDRPVLLSALAFADVLLTLDAADFGDLLGSTFYNLPVLKPGRFPTPATIRLASDRLTAMAKAGSSADR